MRYKRKLDESRFWAKAQEVDGCWVWTGWKTAQGYARYSGHLAHQIAFELMVADIPPGLHLDHLCRRRDCIRPDHLEPVPPRVNNMRSMSLSALNARKTHCQEGHPLSGDNLFINSQGARICRICRKVRNNRGDAVRRGRAA